MKNIRKLRRAVTITVKEMAEYLNINKNEYINIESGRLIPENKEELEEKIIDIINPKLKSKLIRTEFYYNSLKMLYEQLNNQE